jgi:hypothetical protein
MKTLTCLLSLFFTVIVLSSTSAQQTGQDSTGLPGDNFSLHGALQMFQQSASPEDFEKAVNTEGNNVNNLDLNGDGDIDYVRVIDMSEGDVHAFVLQVPVSETESQDVAVIELEKTGPESAVIQILGDEELYGEQVIIEPDGEQEQSEDSKKGKGPHSYNRDDLSYVVVNVWGWPCVRFVYAPAYRPWVSPWRWRYYPAWWRPWRPVRWHVWHPRHIHYHRPFAVVHTHRVVHAHRVYAPARRTSVTVHTRHATSVNHWKVNRSRTTVTGPRGNTATVKKTTVRGPKGNVRGSKTTVTRRKH